MKKVKLILITSIVLISGGCDQSDQIGNNSFFETLSIHLNAIGTGDLEKLGPTVADNVVMIAPDGAKYDTKEVFMNFHTKWFTMKNWEWDYDTLRTESSDSMGYAMIQYRFAQKDSTGTVLFEDQAYLVLLFQNKKDGWQLVHDQNTSIRNHN